jgi:hypothetical protein
VPEADGKYKVEMVEFGSKMLHRIPGMAEIGSDGGKMAPRWQYGKEVGPL